MKTKAIVTFTLFLTIGTIVLSCKKETCTECHYDKDGQEIELGNKCGDEIENLENDGYILNGVKYTAHCGEH